MSGLNGTEVLLVLGRDNIGRPAGPQFQTTTGQIAALGGGAASGIVTAIDTGTTYTTDAGDTFVLWDTITSGAKTTKVTTSVLNDGQVLVIKDYQAGDFPQTVQALEIGVTIENASSYTFDPANGASINLKWDADSQNLVVW